MNNTDLKKRKLTHHKLDSLLEVTRNINKNLSAEELFELFEDVLSQQLGLNKFVLYIYKDRWEPTIIHGDDGLSDHILPAEDLAGFTENTIINDSHPTPLQGFDIVVPVFHKTQPLAYLIIGGLEKEKIQKYFDKHINFLQTLTNLISFANENKKLYKENIKQEAMRREMQLAAELQGMLFPTRFPNNEKIEIDAMYNSHHDIGGDYYDFFILPDGEIAFCIADVSGKGIPAALLMSNFQATIRVLSGFRTSLKEIVVDLNKRVMANAKGEKFITLFLGKYNHESRKLTYINAGHNPPVLLNGNKIEMLQEGSIGLGMFEELPWVREAEVIVEPESILVCYTDGVVEAEDNDGRQFGTQNLSEILIDNRNLNMKELNAEFQMKLEHYKNSKKGFSDDVALLSCRFR